MKSLALASTVLFALAASPAWAETINLTGYKLTFDEEFNQPRSVSQSGTGKTWADIRAEWRYDAESDLGFGDSCFTDASSGLDPLSYATNGLLKITARYDPTKWGPAGEWESGLIHTKNSFTQTYGYFEMRAAFSGVVGSWDAFWMLPLTSVPPTATAWPELDVVEHLGSDNTTSYSFIHTADPNASSPIIDASSSVPAITSGYHTFGVNWQADTIKFYVDGVLKNTRTTPNDMHSPMYLLVDLAVKSGADTKSTMTMNVDYVRAFSNDPSAVAVRQQSVSPPDGADPGLHGATAAP